jgi:uncharacterized damage-inducible protein DinB
VQIDEARTLMDYNGWANHQLLGGVCLLSPSEFVQDLGASFGSIKGTLVHILDSEWHWLQLWQGKPRTQRPQPGDFGDAAALAAAFPALEDEQRAFIDGLTDASLRSRRQVNERHYVLAHLIQHVVDHSTYHRGQVASLLRQLGHTPPATGFRTGFLDERGLFETS